MKQLIRDFLSWFLKDHFDDIEYRLEKIDDHRSELELASIRLRTRMSEFEERTLTEIDKLDRRLVSTRQSVDRLSEWANKMHTWAKEISERVSCFSPSPQMPPEQCG